MSSTDRWNLNLPLSFHRICIYSVREARIYSLRALFQRIYDTVFLLRHSIAANRSLPQHLWCTTWHCLFPSQEQKSDPFYALDTCSDSHPLSGHAMNCVYNNMYGFSLPYPRAERLRSWMIPLLVLPWGPGSNSYRSRVTTLRWGTLRNSFIQIVSICYDIS